LCVLVFLFCFSQGMHACSVGVCLGWGGRERERESEDKASAPSPGERKGGWVGTKKKGREGVWRNAAASCWLSLAGVVEPSPPPPRRLASRPSAHKWALCPLVGREGDCVATRLVK
jgi:hypothetical protein